MIATDEYGAIADARIAVGACSPVAQADCRSLRPPSSAAALAEAPRLVEPAHLAPLSPIDDIRGSGAFRSAAALDLVRDLLAGFAGHAERRAA